jgi:hypothetical protein
MKTKLPFFFLLVFLKMSAQTTFQKAIGTGANENALWVDLGNTPETFVVCGENSTNGSGVVMKLSDQGEMLWSKQINENGMTSCRSIVRSGFETGYLVCGNNSEKGIFALKLDEEGQLVWQKFFAGSTFAQRITKISDGYIIAGVLQDPATLIISKINENGDLIWSSARNGASSESGYSVIERSNGDLICFGTANTNGGVFIYDKDGGFLGCQTVGGSGTEAINYAESFSNGDFVCGDHSWSWPAGSFNYDQWITKFAENGDFLWSKTYSSSATVLRGMVKICSDEGLILAPTDYTTNFNDGHLIRTDAEGNVIWSKSYGGTGNDRLLCVIEHPQGGFIAVGNTKSFGNGGSDFYILKTNANGTINNCPVSDFTITTTDGATDAGGIAEVNSAATANSMSLTGVFKCQPLDASESPIVVKKADFVIVSNLLGQKVYEFKPNANETINLQDDLDAGTYFTSEYTKSGKLIATKKVIVFSKK